MARTAGVAINAGRAEERDRLLNTLIQTLTEDERIVAAWLTGSFGRGDADELSDLDLVAVVGDTWAKVLCRRDSSVRAGTTPERLALVSTIGTPLVIHENHHNAPADGSFTVVIYEGSAQAVDWTLIPRNGACRPEESLILFDSESIPVCPAPPELDDDFRMHQLAERHAFFWMMTVPTIKYALRGDAVYFHILLDVLDRSVGDIERLLSGSPPVYQRGSAVNLTATVEEQLEAVRTICQRVVLLDQEIQSRGITVLDSPIRTIDNLLDEGSG